MNPKKTLRQQIEDDQKGSPEKHQREKVVAEAMAMLCCPADANGKVIKEIITSWDKIRIIFEGGMQMILGAHISEYEGNAEVTVNHRITPLDLVDYGLLPQSAASQFTRNNLLEEQHNLKARLKIIEKNLSNIQSPD